MAFSLLIGMLFAPLEANAGLFSIFSTEASAETGIWEMETKNSQNMGLLQATISSSTILQEKDTKKTGDTPIDLEGTEVSIVSENALMPSVSPIGTSEGIGSGDLAFDQISVYVVRSGDTVSQVADMFDVTVDTILSANDMKKGDKLKQGDVLLILPFSGIEHTVTKGQTLQGIASLYKVDINDILISNDIDADTKLSIGEKLMIPGANMLSETKTNTGKNSTSGGIAKPTPYPTTALKNADGYFINPLPSGRKTRGPNPTHKGVDIGAPTGSPIYASAAGRVTFARSGYNGGFGTLVIIAHPNGTETLYAHMSKLGTTIGSQVTQGQIIGYVGSTGRSTGPHLHFEVHGAKNPGTDWSWKY